MRREIVEQYTSEFASIQEMAAAGFRAPGARSSFDRSAVGSSMGTFENGAFFTGRPGGVGGSGVGGGVGGGIGGGGIGGSGGGGGGSGGGGEQGETEAVTDDHRTMLMEIRQNDQRFVRAVKRLANAVTGAHGQRHVWRCRTT